MKSDVVENLKSTVIPNSTKDLKANVKEVLKVGAKETFKNGKKVVKNQTMSDEEMFQKVLFFKPMKNFVFK